jgi:protein-S-isoprenylcysteine O-methyltransferase Ste14
MLSNRFFSPTVRIQSDRGHQVISGGPYQIIRHPGYSGWILQMLAAPLALGSWWGLIPGLLSACLYGIRTALEDRTLHRELPGYTDYAARVRYRLLPGIW